MRIWRLALVLLPVFALTSCRETKLRIALGKFYGTQVNIPDMRQMVMGTDSITVCLDTVPVLAVVYRDARSCVPCQIDRMSDYRELIEFRDSVGSGYYPVFVFSPTRGTFETVRYTLCRTRFRFPIFIDDGTFAQTNPTIPSFRELQVFLLDKNRKVVLAGDPSHNPQMMKLYKQTIRNLLDRGGVM